MTAKKETFWVKIQGKAQRTSSDVKEDTNSESEWCNMAIAQKNEQPRENSQENA